MPPLYIKIKKREKYARKYPLSAMISGGLKGPGVL
jgi:hypothetical protein